ncbi:polyprotein [Gossypium australe]|uniref:Polyprotein n=1 Tax=Gossypium australe TaxID=47621 RepID=A0A5B6WEE9_9ROSI|nr:polyprotein [Gossypium australe]
MLGYDYEVVYRKGSGNLAADALSRKQDLKEGQYLQLTRSTISYDLLSKVQASYLVDSKVQKLWNVVGLKQELFQLFHASTLGRHSGVHATRKRLASLLYWKGLTTDVNKWVKECSTCQRCKSETMASPGLLQPLPIPDRAWSSISIDFIERLPNLKGKTVIFVVVDRLTKYAHFVEMAHPFTVVVVAQKFMDNVYKLHGMPDSIISNRDEVFVMRRILNQKLVPKFFRPFKVEDKVEKVAYRLKLPQGSRVHPTFHVSQLKRHVGTTPVQAHLPVIDEQGSWAKEPAKILEGRMVKKGNVVVTEVLVEWAHHSQKMLHGNPSNSSRKSSHTLIL